MQLDWYSNNPEAVWLKDSLSNLAADGIHLHPPLWGARWWTSSAEGVSP